MEARMKHPVVVVPAALQAMMALDESVRGTGLPETVAWMVELRVSQINGCSWCTVEHAQQLRDAGESEERIAAVAAWREAPYFSDAERVALALAEALTRISDTPDPIPDGLWDEVSRHYDERQLSGLLLEISKINVWNRLNVAVRQIAGTTPGA